MNEPPNENPPNPNPNPPNMGPPNPMPPNMGGPYMGPPVQDAAQTDKIIGIIMMVLSACGAVVSGLVVLGGGALATMGAGAAGAGRNPGGAAAAGAVGAGIAVVGVILLIVSILNIAIGYGIMKSMRTAFVAGAILSGINVVLNLFSLGRGFSGIFGLAIAAGILIYCYMRLSGKYGTPPV